MAHAVCHVGQGQEQRREGWCVRLKGGGERGQQSMGCSMSPGDATCSLSSSVTPRPAAPRQPEHNNRTAVIQQRRALMYPELMFNERSIFRQLLAKSENGFIVLLLKGGCVRVCRGQTCTFVLCRSECVCVSDRCLQESAVS